MTGAEREQIEVDVAIVGGGPAGLAAAIHIVQEARRRGVPPPDVALLEKAPELGAHSLSGAIMDPRGLDALLPGWRDAGAPVEGPVLEDAMLFLTRSRALTVPLVPPAMRHHGGYVVSLQRLVAWLGEHAEALGVNLFAGFAVTSLLFEGEAVVGIRTGDRGLDRRGVPRGNFAPGYDVRARITLLADGVRGNLSQELVRAAHLDAESNAAIYAGGAKEVWRLPAGRVRGGRVWHTLGWPLARDTFGGAFLYEMQQDMVSLGLVVGLDAADPRLDVQERLQELKTHPFFREFLAGGEIVSCGAKAIPEGGYWAIPRLAVDGAMLLGDAAGLVNALRLKGIHLAIESGISAAQVALDALAADDVSAKRLLDHDRRVRQGGVGRELYRVRNFRQAYQRGFARGMLHTALQLVTGGRGAAERYPADEDHRRRAPLASWSQPPAPAPAFDGRALFDKVSSVHHSGTRHEENQPPHLVVVDPELCVARCTAEYGNPCQSFCPAGVYEVKRDDGAPARLHLNFSNCVHCKICDIADPYGVIYWVPPEGGEGPRYRLT